MKHPEIPAFAYRLFKWFCKNDLFEELEGDLEETFLRNKKHVGLKKARRIYTREVLKMIRPTVISKPKSGPGYQVALLASYVNISLRNIKRHKLFSFINIFSLSVAMSTGLIVIGMITDLLKFDEFHEKRHHIYRVLSTPHYQQRAYDVRASSPLPLGDALKEDFEHLSLVQLGRRFNGKADINGKKIQVSGIYADEHFFDFMSFELLSGNKSTALRDPYSILITESVALKTFERTDVIGEEVTIGGKGTFYIKGILKDPPKFSHIQYEVIGSISTIPLMANQGFFDETYNEWQSVFTFYNYLYLPTEEQVNEVNAWLKQAAERYYPNAEEVSYTFEMQRMDKILPGPDVSDSIGPKMIFLPIIILSVIAGAILLSAIFNYTNLSMARALRRAREVGIRKLNGANGKAVYFQFTVEAIVLSLISLAIGVVIFMFIRSEFIALVPRANEVLNLHLTPTVLGWFTFFAIVTGLIAGLAPSLYFSRLSSLNAFRSNNGLRTLGRINLRKSFIVAQFAISMIFILAIVITNKQYRFSLDYDLGFETENILNIPLEGNDPAILRTEWSNLAEVEEVSFSSIIPGVGSLENLQLVDQRNQDSVWVNSMRTNESYIENFGLNLLAGRAVRDGENQSMVVNEQFVKDFGLESPQSALGTTFRYGAQPLSIVGVIEDFHYANLEEPINSFAMLPSDNFLFANVKLNTSDVISSVERLEGVWDEVDSKNKMHSVFMDDQIQDYYQFLVDVMKLFGFVGFLAISISCLGLFGMAIYSTETRLKEIGIRKTFGASEKTLIFLLSKGFMKMVLWAILIGSPICYFLFDKVVLAQNFYRTNITIVEVGGSILLLLVLCSVTIITQTWSAARKNPTSVLRNE